MLGFVFSMQGSRRHCFHKDIMKTFPFLFNLFCVGVCHAECVTPDLIPDAIVPKIRAQASAPHDFVPSGWKLVEQVEADFDGNGTPDVAISMVEVDPRKFIHNACGMGESNFDSNPYAVLVALRKPDGLWQLGGVDFGIIPRRDDPVLAQPYSGIEAKNSRLYVRHHLWQSAGSWFASRTTHVFRYQDACMRLIGSEFTSMHRASGAESRFSTNYLTGRVIESGRDSVSGKSIRKIGQVADKRVWCLGSMPSEPWR